MKKAYTILEVIFTITLIAFLYSFFTLNIKNENKLDELTNKIVLYINQVRLNALLDDKYSYEENLWFKKRWTMKFFRCRSSVGGVYFSIYSDTNLSGHPSFEDALIDPLTNKRVYSSNFCEENEKNSKYVLLTKNYDIENVIVSCNTTSSLGQISFGTDGKIYSKLSNDPIEMYSFEILEPCFIEFQDKKGEKRIIKIENKTSYGTKTQ